MDDLISRQAAINAADSTDYTGLTIEDVKKVTDEVVKALKQLPSVQERKGRWIEKEVTDDSGAKIITQWQSAKCSVCGLYHTTPYLYYFKESKYCPNCGASMTEGAEDD